MLGELDGDNYSLILSKTQYEISYHLTYEIFLRLNALLKIVF